MTCESCLHLRVGESGDRRFCLYGRWGFPSIGPRCADFTYMPGSDEAEDLDKERDRGKRQ